LGQLIGQSETVEALRGMFQAKKVPRTFFVFGPYGCGKTSTARLIARYVNCQEPKDNADPCGECVSCKAMDRLSHRDVTEMNCGEARGIDDIRNLLKTVTFAPQMNYRIFILDEVHQLTPQAAQALLKDLEEPPPRTIFVLCTTEPDRVISTIVSRAAKLPIHKVPLKATAKLLSRVFKQECKKKVKPAVFLEISKAVDGHPRDALTVLESVIHRVNQGDFKGENVTKMVTRIVSQAVPGHPDKFAKIILLSVYNGAYTRAVDSVRKFKKAGGALVRLAGACLRYHAEASAARCSPKLKDPFYGDWHSLIKDTVLKAKMPVETMTTILSIFVDAQTQLKSYLVDEEYVMLAAVMKAVNTVKA
jgi:DNA polymerase III subunit gamma/tau